ncbi:MAG: GNAT family N-acetyltransferase [Pseudomonadota bacterium]
MTQLRPTERIRTPRLTLRPLARADATRLAEICSDYELARMTSRVPHPYDRDSAEAFLEYLETADDENVFAITAPNGELIGNAGLTRTGLKTYELGYLVASDRRGCGVASEAARALALYALDAFGARRVTSGHYVDNPASGRVLWKTGFRPTGEIVRQWSEGRKGHVLCNRMALWRVS